MHTSRKFGRWGSRLATLTLVSAALSSCESAPPQVNLLSAALLTSTVCLDFSNSLLEPAHQEVIRGKMVEDFSPHGYNFILMDPEYNACAYRIGFEAHGDGVWGMAYAKEAYAEVYVETIRQAANGTRIEQFLQGVANAASHEMGHLLGFGHTDDPGNVMSVPESSSERFFDNLEFRPRPPVSAASDDGTPQQE